MVAKVSHPTLVGAHVCRGVLDSKQRYLTDENSLVGVSNQLSWIAIGITSIRFRAALELQGKTHLLPFKNWTYPVGPWIAVVLNSFLVLVQGWKCFSPKFDAVSFVSFYIELPIMLVMFVAWKVIKRTKFVRLEDVDLVTDVHTVEEGKPVAPKTWRQKAKRILTWVF